jgi:hypothetical protein
METNPLYNFKSHIEGKNADVSIFADRIEWSRKGGVSTAKVLGAAMTVGMSLVATGVSKRGSNSEMIPVKSLTSVISERDGLRFWKVTVTASGNSIDFRCDRSEADEVKRLLTQLMVGSHPAQVKASASAAPASVSAPIVSAPAVPAATSGIAEELKKLAELRDAGILTTEEFASQKAKLLGG